MGENLKISSSPHIRDKATTGNIMLWVVIALLPATFFGIYNFRDTQAWLLILVTVATAVLTEFLYQKFMHKKVTISDFSAVVTGLLLALNLPPEAPLWMGALGSVFAILIVKQLFGGLGQNIMNPALAARCFLLIAYTGPMTTFVYDGVSGATPLAILKPGSEVEGTVKLLDMFIGKTAGVIGETSVICLLIGAAYLLIRKV
ncbi:MAG: RnfABCDGE type electron transport complex subunit D, partial [Tyzzerella sp.]|nr:RnfABCDGE type electron transport complex subunit D [Tyzzerella sp.]